VTEPVVDVLLENDPAAPTDASIPRLPFIDGARGLAALVVCVRHLLAVNGSYTALPGATAFDLTPGQAVVWPVHWGNEMVLLFLLVSGFSLAYSEEIRRARNKAPTTYAVFAARRFHRIAATYYAAFGLGLIVFLLPISTPVGYSPIFHDSTNITWAGSIAHLGFVHNLRGQWLFQGNSPLWSMAYEVQLYVAFPLLYWGMRRTNPIAVAIVAVLAVKAISLLHLGFPVFGLMRWFVTGMVIAVMFRRSRVPAWLFALAGVVMLAVAGLNLHQLQSETRHDVVWLAAFVLIALAMIEAPTSRWNPLNTHPLRWLGARSYSLYALHLPLAYLMYVAVTKAGATGGAVDILVLGIGLPLSILLANAAFMLIERPALARARDAGSRRKDEQPQPAVNVA
jgi:peptidoglycan/LPS O-acetylase OafA/YrhL